MPNPKKVTVVVGGVRAAAAIVDTTPEGLRVFRTVSRVRIAAQSGQSVLVQGETGTGKEGIAQAIHDLSRRRQQRFVVVNCAAIPAALLEAELFGHDRGAFTGAVTSRVGRFQAADRGTLFLDEIGELPLELQPKLLRAIQHQEIDRVGSSQPTRIDVRSGHTAADANVCL